MKSLELDLMMCIFQNVNSIQLINITKFDNKMFNNLQLADKIFIKIKLFCRFL